MIRITEKNICTGCNACANICPKKCISMKADAEGFRYPEVNSNICIDCGLCEKACPVKHEPVLHNHIATKAYAAYHLNENIRMKSSSGGMFSQIAEWVIRQNGVVFGAAFADDFKSVHHVCVDSLSELEKLRGSKYVQSDTEDTYLQAKKYLDSGRLVLYTGTPCQIGGLYSFLQKDYDNLYTQDLICHGVPSPMVWGKYVGEREKAAASKTQRMNFRYKKYSWNSYAVLFEFSNNTAYEKHHQDDAFMRVFLSNACLRPSCHTCSFKTIARQSDMTLADFWGIQNVLPEMDDDKGTSLLLVHSAKGEQLFEQVSKGITEKEVPLEVVERYNSAVSSSASCHKNRNQFLKSVQKNSVEKMARRYCKTSLVMRAKIMLANTAFGDLLRKVKHSMRA